jgi:hypothetical protein
LGEPVERVGVATQPQFHWQRYIGARGQPEVVERGEGGTDNLGGGQQRTLPAVAGFDRMAGGDAGEICIADAAGGQQRREQAEHDLQKSVGRIGFAVFSRFGRLRSGCGGFDPRRGGCG